MMQFTAVVLMSLLTFKMLMLRKWIMKDAVVRRARYEMASATTLLAVHFLLQLALGLRTIGVTQSVMLNLAMLIPASYLFATAVLSLQQRGKLSVWDRLAGPLAWLAAMAMLLAAVAADGEPLLADTAERRLAELGGALGYMAMQCYYTWRHTVALRQMHHALSDYYDSGTDGMLRWMQLSIVGLMLLALMVPVAIFGTGVWMLSVAFAVYFFIFYLVDSFCYYVASNAPARMSEAEQSAEEEMEMRKETGEAKVAPEVGEHIGRAVEAWMARGGHLRSGITQPVAAAEIGIPKYQLTTWLHQQGVKYNEWLARHRVAEAKRVMLEHPEWGMDAVAEYCGFSDRSVMHRKFREMEGVTPAEFVGRVHKTPGNL